MDALSQDKRETVGAALEDGIAMLHIDARRDGVDVPAHLLGDPALRLNIAWGFNLPELTIDEDGIYAVLRFGVADYGCYVPWSALYGVTQPEYESRGVLWPASMPRELLASLPGAEGVGRIIIGPPPEDATAEVSGRQDPSDDAPAPNGRGHLRLVKG